MANKLTLNSIDQNVFLVTASQDTDRSQTRADIIAEGRVLFYEHGRKGQMAIAKARNASADVAPEQITSKQYAELNPLRPLSTSSRGRVRDSTTTLCSSASCKASIKTSSPRYSPAFTARPSMYLLMLSR